MSEHKRGITILNTGMPVLVPDSWSEPEEFFLPADVENNNKRNEANTHIMPAAVSTGEPEIKEYARITVDTERSKEKNEGTRILFSILL